MKIEVFAFVAGIIVFFALLGSFYFLLDNKSFKTASNDTTPTPSEKLEVLGEESQLKVPTVQPQQQQQTAPQPPQQKKGVLPDMTINPEKKYTAVLQTTKGDISIELNAKVAPQTVNNFIYNARTDFYDNTIFHRVIKDFMIQGGDPKGDGTGGPGYKVPSEISSDLKHVRGAVSMARLPDDVNPKKESSGSQFFIMHKDSPQLDGEYTVFGKVVDGMDVVDAIADQPVTQSKSGENSKPVDPVKIKNIKIIEE